LRERQGGGAKRAVPQIQYIRNFEYTESVKLALRQFKAEIFQALAHPTRIAMVEALRGGEVSAGEINSRLGLEQANASQHLAILRAKQIVVSRREGNQVFYTLRDPVLAEVLDLLRRYFYSRLSETSTMLDEMQREEAEVR
jgi:ArsR family transcriptional regulator